MDVARTENQTSLRHGKESGTNTYYNVGEPQKRYAKGKRPDTKATRCDSVPRKHLEREVRPDTRQTGGYWGWGGGWEPSA